MAGEGIARGMTEGCMLGAAQASDMALALRVPMLLFCPGMCAVMAGIVRHADVLTRHIAKQHALDTSRCSQLLSMHETCAVPISARPPAVQHPYHCREEGLDEGTVMGHEFVGRVVTAGALVCAGHSGVPEAHRD